MRDTFPIYFQHDAKLSLERLSEIHDKEDEETLNETKIQEIPDGKELRLENVDFSYDGTSIGEPVLKGINLTIPPHKQTAIVGMSGSGKTTLVKLLLGFYPLPKGSICPICRGRRILSRRIFPCWSGSFCPSKNIKRTHLTFAYSPKIHYLCSAICK